LLSLQYNNRAVSDYEICQLLNVSKNYFKNINKAKYFVITGAIIAISGLQLDYTKKEMKGEDEDFTIDEMYFEKDVKTKNLFTDLKVPKSTLMRIFEKEKSEAITKRGWFLWKKGVTLEDLQCLTLKHRALPNKDEVYEKMKWKISKKCFDERLQYLDYVQLLGFYSKICGKDLNEILEIFSYERGYDLESINFKKLKPYY